MEIHMKIFRLAALALGLAAVGPVHAQSSKTLCAADPAHCAEITADKHKRAAAREEYCKTKTHAKECAEWKQKKEERKKKCAADPSACPAKKKHR